jgi:hypothetical protein
MSVQVIGCNRYEAQMTPTARATVLHGASHGSDSRSSLGAFVVGGKPAVSYIARVVAGALQVNVLDAAITFL